MATPRIQSVDRAFSLLACLAREHDSRSLPAMAAECGLTIATAHRLLATLETHGAVIHTSPGRYRIGMGLIELARGSRQEELLIAVAEPTLRRMTRELCPTAHMGTLDAEFMVSYLAKSAQRSHQVPTRAGSKLEAYCSGLGKVLLAALNEEERTRYLAEGPFIQLTKKTIVEPAELEQELALTSQRGYAIDNCELFENLRCVAVPIFDQANEVVAALSASYPPDQLPLAKVREVAASMQHHARVIGAKLFPSYAGQPLPCGARRSAPAALPGEFS